MNNKATLNYEQWCNKNIYVKHLIRSMKSSFPEQYIGYYLQKSLGEEAIEYQKHFDWLGKSSLDIYVPSLNLAIEYDGVYYHANKAASDYCKTRLARAHGIYVIHILEQTSEQSKSKKHNEISYYYIDKYKNIDVAINELFRRINIKYSLSIKSDVDIERDKKDIISYVQHKYYKRSIAYVWPESIDYWNDKENNVTVFDVLCTSEKNYKLKCPHCGRSFRFSMKHTHDRKSLTPCECEYKKIKEALQEAVRKYKETGEVVSFDESLDSRRLYDRMASNVRHVFSLCGSKEEAEMYKKIGFDSPCIDFYLSN